MASLPYVTAPGNVTKALNGIVSASTPERVTQDFVKTILGIPGGSGDQMTSYLKKIGFASSDGAPTPIYKKFRNESTRGSAAAEALRHGYAALYARNEYAHELSDSKLKGLIIEETGASNDSYVVTNILGCIKNIKAFANFNALQDEIEEVDMRVSPVAGESPPVRIPTGAGQEMGLNLSYTII